MAKRSPFFTSGKRVRTSVAGTWKPLNFLCPPFWAFAPLQLFPDMGRFFFNDFKPLYILDFYIMDRFVSLLTHWVWNATSFSKRPYNFKRKKAIKHT